MAQIKCQAKHSETGGCHTCGGFGYVLEMAECPVCKRTYWDRERRGTTVYEGKQLRAFDGLELVYTLDKGAVCATCVASDDRKKDAR